MPNPHIAIVDLDAERRAAICCALQDMDLAGDPYCDMTELPAPQRCHGIFMVEDDANLLTRVLAHLASAPKPTAIIAYSKAPELGKVVSAVRKGVIDYLAWPATKAELRNAVRQANASLMAKMKSEERVHTARRLVSRLTDRERQVIKAVATGMTNREIAGVLGISHRTVEIHRSNALIKLEANNSPEAVTIAHDAGLIH